MENTYKERITNPTHQNEQRRNYIIENYKEFIPDIESKIYEKQSGRFDYSLFCHEYKNKIITAKFNQISQIIIDIRNNTTPSTYYSNSISKTDNKFSNETKLLIRALLAKGWTNNQIAYEMEKVYGHGVVSYHTGLIDDTPWSSMLVLYAVKFTSAYLLFRTTRFLYYKCQFNKYIKFGNNIIPNKYK